MKKVAIVLVVIMVIGILAGGAYALSDGFKKVPWEKDPSTETNILTESKDLLNNHASITFGTGDNTWTISTTDKLEPIYIDDLRAPGKGIEIGHSNSGGSSAGIPLESNIIVSGNNLVNISINGTSPYGNSGFLNYSISLKDNVYVWDYSCDKFFENIVYTWHGDTYAYSNLEGKIKSDGYQFGDSYFLGSYQFVFEFKNIDKYGSSSTLINDSNKAELSTVIIVDLPVYYRVK